MTSATQIQSLTDQTILSLQQDFGNTEELFPTFLFPAAVEIKVSDAHANSENTFNSKKSPSTAKAKIPEGEEDKQFKPDHFEKENPKPNPSHVYSTAATAKPDTPLTSTSRAGKHEGRTNLTGAISKDSDDIEIIL